MRVKIHPKVRERYVLSCPLSPRMGRTNLNHEWGKKLEQIADEWLEIETKYMFGNQLNTVPIEGVSENGLRIMHWAIACIENDERESATHRSVDYVMSAFGETSAGAMYHRREEISDDHIMTLVDDFAKEIGVDRSAIDNDIVLRVLRGKQHHCRPIAPLVNASNHREHFHYARLRPGSHYTARWAEENGVITL